MKKIVIKPSKIYWVNIVIGVVLVLLSLLFAPIWQKTNLPFKSWGEQIINLIIAGLLLFYLFKFVLKRITKNGNGAIKTLTIVEFTILSIIALGCIVSKFNLINISEACAILGLILWIRGTIEILRAYYYRAGSNVIYPIWWLFVSIAMVTLGTVLMIKPIFSNILILILFVIAMLVLGVLLIAYGIGQKPKTAKKKK